MATRTEQALELLRERGVATSAEMEAAGVHHELVRRLVAQGRVERVARGIYTLPLSGAERATDMAALVAAAPGGVLCLLSALAAHQIGTQSPFEVWLAISRRARQPARLAWNVRVVRYAEATFQLGVETRNVAGVDVRVYNIPRTVADCFKFRHLVGLDVAVEALREVRRQGLATPAQIGQFAEALKVDRFMRPYMEAVQ